MGGVLNFLKTKMASPNSSSDLFNDDSDDYSLPFLVDDGLESDNPVIRVVTMLKILFLNLFLGLVFTICCLKLRHCIGQCLGYLLCGLCDDCDFDYDGSYPSRSSQKGRPRRSKVRRRTSSSAINVEDDDDNCVQGCGNIFEVMWIMFKRFCSNKKLVKKVSALLLGIVFACVYFFGGSENLIVDPPTPIHSYSHYNVFTKNTGDSSRVFFITPTSTSGIQIARLTRLAQALYRSRDSVTWVIVSTDPVPGRSDWFRTEHWGSSQINKWSGNSTRVSDHLEDVYDIVSRFGIPFVILSGHVIHHKNVGFASAQMNKVKGVSTFAKATQVGISWVVKTFNDGVFLVGSEENAYNYKLFAEVQTTKILSSWPTAFDPRYRFGLSSPLLDPYKNVAKGYFRGGTVKMNEVPLEFAGFAVNLRIGKELQSGNNLWKLTFDNVFTTSDVGLEPVHVRPLGNRCADIYVWKLITGFSHFRVINRQKIPLKYKWLNTNVPALHKLIVKWFATDIDISYFDF